jgi:ABC-type polysaccharide/polyol phosphate export permease
LGVLDDFVAIATRWRTWFLMANQDLVLRYKRSVLGPFWISIAMAIMIVGVGVLFAEIQNIETTAFLIFMGLGMLPWTLLSITINESAGLVIESEGHLRNVALPVPLLAAKVVYRNFAVFGHNALVVGGMLLLLGAQPGPMAWTSLFSLLLYAFLGIFIGVTLGPICARFRDLPLLIANLVQFAFFVTPIFWRPHSGLERTLWVDANPFYHLIEIFRGPLMSEPVSLTSWSVSLMILAAAALTAVVSLSFTRRQVYLWL